VGSDERGRTFFRNRNEPTTSHEESRRTKQHRSRLLGGEIRLSPERSEESYLPLSSFANSMTKFI